MKAVLALLALPALAAAQAVSGLLRRGDPFSPSCPDCLCHPTLPPDHQHAPIHRPVPASR